MEKEGKQFRRTEDGHLILMTPEERKLLITDLTSRIEYGVICMIERVDDFGPRFRKEKLTGYCKTEDGCFYFDFGYGLSVTFAEKVKPYLRPLSSMTEEEKRELKELHFYYTDAHIVNDEDNDFKPIIVDEIHCSYIIDWLNAHHFDYRGLIDNGLAFEASISMYNNM